MPCSPWLTSGVGAPVCGVSVRIMQLRYAFRLYPNAVQQSELARAHRADGRKLPSRSRPSVKRVRGGPG
ncbi:helix-turn-helix domain-containing protein [Streptomyces sp. NPDC127574]|uniref:helix-turn-helix domain-containing protein n=1 Tax=Streptomyces sp. NPDC127574 TaxID=3345401 RepID=UPI00362CC117